MNESAECCRITCSWCGTIQRPGVLPASHTICPACRAKVVEDGDVEDDLATLRQIEQGEKWWQGWLAGERARRDDAQARLTAFQRHEALQAYASAGLFTLAMLILSWLLMAW